MNVTLTNPRDPRSVLRFVDIVVQLDGRTRVIWTSQEGVSYEISAAGDPAGDWTVLDTRSGGAGQSTTFYIDPGSPAAPRRHYKIGVPY